MKLLETINDEPRNSLWWRIGRQILIMLFRSTIFCYAHWSIPIEDAKIMSKPQYMWFIFAFTTWKHWIAALKSEHSYFKNNETPTELFLDASNKSPFLTNWLTCFLCTADAEKWIPLFSFKISISKTSVFEENFWDNVYLKSFNS